MTLLHSASGQNKTVSYTFTHKYKTVVIAVGGYSGASITSGSGWAQTHSNNSSSNIATGWRKDNVQNGESVSVKCNDRYGIAIYGVN